MSDDFEPTEMGENLPSDPFGRSRPRSFINLVPSAIQVLFLQAFQKRPDLFGLAERDLYKKLRNDNKTPDPTDNRLRLQFWQQYDSAQAASKTINMSQVVAGICPIDYLYNKYLKHPERVAWLICMPVAYDTYLTEALQFGMEQLREVLELPHTLSNGKIDVKLLELKAKITFALDARKNGGIVQRVEQKQMNLNIHTNDKAVAQAAMGTSMEDMQRRIKQLELEERKLLGLKESREKEVTDES